MAYAAEFEDDGRRGGGLRGALATTLWAGGTLGVFVAVLVWAYGLGLRNPAEVPALSPLSGDWRSAPAAEERGGRVIADQGVTAYSAIGEAAEPATAPEPARQSTPAPSASDIDAARALAEGGDAPIGSEGMLAMVSDAGRKNDQMSRARVLDLDLIAPRSGAAVSLESRPDFPPNVGRGSEAPPQRVVTHHAEPPAPAAAIEPRSTPAPATPAARAAEPASAPAGAEAGEPPGAETAAIAVAPAPDAAQPPPEEAARADAAPAERAPEETARVAAPAPAAVAPQPEAAAPAPPPARPAAGDGVPRPDANEEQAAIETADLGRVWQVQVGALNSEALAEARWSELQDQHRDLLGSERLDVQTVSIGGSQLYRVRFGAFESRSQASGVCSALAERGVECFPANK